MGQARHPSIPVPAEAQGVAGAAGALHEVACPDTVGQVDERKHREA